MWISSNTIWWHCPQHRCFHTVSSTGVFTLCGGVHPLQVSSHCVHPLQVFFTLCPLQVFFALCPSITGVFTLCTSITGVFALCQSITGVFTLCPLQVFSHCVHCRCFHTVSIHYRCFHTVYIHYRCFHTICLSICRCFSSTCWMQTGLCVQGTGCGSPAQHLRTVCSAPCASLLSLTASRWIPPANTSGRYIIQHMDPSGQYIRYITHGSLWPIHQGYNTWIPLANTSGTWHIYLCLQALCTRLERHASEVLVEPMCVYSVYLYLQALCTRLERHASEVLVQSMCVYSVYLCLQALCTHLEGHASEVLVQPVEGASHCAAGGRLCDWRGETHYKLYPAHIEHRAFI